MKFVDPGVGTVNEGYLLAALSHHGTLMASGREVCYRKEYGPDDERFIGDAFALFLDGGILSVVGVEIKDWAAPVTPKLAASYLETYGSCCDFVYLAARRFLPGVPRVRGLGLLSLDGPKVIRRADRLSPDPASWRFVISQMSDLPAVAPRHPRQRTLLERAAADAPIREAAERERDA